MYMRILGATLVMTALLMSKTVSQWQGKFARICTLTVTAR
jgi:hypothetical protein